MTEDQPLVPEPPKPVGVIVGVIVCLALSVAVPVWGLVVAGSVFLAGVYWWTRVRVRGIKKGPGSEGNPGPS